MTTPTTVPTQWWEIILQSAGPYGLLVFASFIAIRELYRRNIALEAQLREDARARAESDKAWLMAFNAATVQQQSLEKAVVAFTAEVRAWREARAA